jgi:hypothetical protein
MDIEKLEKANSLNEGIKICQMQIKILNYMVHNDVSERDSYLTFTGAKKDIIIPQSLFKVIGKIILAEYQHRINELENEFRNL